jgi:hypothetical protein
MAVPYLQAALYAMSANLKSYNLSYIEYKSIITIISIIRIICHSLKSICKNEN